MHRKTPLHTVTADVFSGISSRHVADGQAATNRGHEEVRRTGKLHPLVDPAEYGVIRQALPRFDPLPDGKWVLAAVGVPLPLKVRLDTTGSMGNNVDIALKALPDTARLFGKVLPPDMFDLQVAIGIFADCVDRFVLCRPQFEADPEKIIEQLTLMHPEKCSGGGNGGEDPQYGLFGAAYLTDARIAAYGLKGYDITVTDEPARDFVTEDGLERVYGESVFERLASNGFGDIKPETLPSLKQIVRDINRHSHAFLVLVGSGNYGIEREFWTDIYGADHFINIRTTEFLPYVQAAIGGLTEGTLGLSDVEEFLTGEGLSQNEANSILRSVSHIPRGVGAELRAKLERPLPKNGDVFENKTDLYPISAEDTAVTPPSDPIKWNL